MKRQILTWFLVATLLLLTACSKTPAPPQTTSPVTPIYDRENPAPLGAVMTVPDVAVTLEDMAEHEVFRVEITDSYGDHFIYAWEYSFATDTTVFYVYDEYEGEEIVNVVKRDKATRYFRLIGDEKFVVDNETDEFTWQADKDAFTAMIKDLTQFSEPVENVTYKKMEDLEARAGDACVYQVWSKNLLIGYAFIDKATGIMSAWMNESQKTLTVITDISTTEANIPTYKYR